MAIIAISYRRADTQAITGRIFDRLSAHFGRENVFMDIDSIPAGVDFRAHISTLLNKCDLLLAVVGPNWAGDSIGNTRIHRETDWVRIEIETALARNIPIIPLLVEGAILPDQNSLPSSLKDLVFRQGLAIESGQEFTSQIERLFRSIESISSTEEPKYSYDFIISKIFGSIFDLTLSYISCCASLILSLPIGFSIFYQERVDFLEIILAAIAVLMAIIFIVQIQIKSKELRLSLLLINIAMTSGVIIMVMYLLFQVRFSLDKFPSKFLILSTIISCIITFIGSARLMNRVYYQNRRRL